MFKSKLTRFGGAALLATALVACGDDDVTDTQEPGTIAATAAASSDLSTLTTALDAAGLVSTLEGTGPFTVFAPTNAAFEALGPDVVAALLEDGNIDILSRVLTFHVVSGAAAFAEDLSDGQTFATVEGGELTVGVSGGSVTVNGAAVVTADIEASNGVVHIVDDVLVPSDTDVYETAVLTEGTTTLATAVGAADLAGALQGDGPFTVFAPVNAAFEALGTDRLDVLLDPANQALLQKVLTYHVISGAAIEAGDLSDGQMATTLEGSDVTFDLSDPSDPKVNGVSIIATDIPVENGVIHLIDGVLTDNLDLVDVATVEGFSTLTALVDQQGLTETLRGDNGGDGYTVFAPTNAAFDALSSVPSGDALTNVLLYHVVPATVESSALSDGQVVGTAYTGHDFTVNIDGSVTLTDESGNTVNVTLTDVPAANGIIHVIDAVLIPTP